VAEFDSTTAYKTQCECLFLQGSAQATSLGDKASASESCACAGADYCRVTSKSGACAWSATFYRGRCSGADDHGLETCFGLWTFHVSIFSTWILTATGIVSSYYDPGFCYDFGLSYSFYYLKKSPFKYCKNI
jgi:hypothetical protein